MKQINIYLRDEAEQAYYRLKEFGMDIQTLVRKAIVDKAKELDLE